MIEDLVAKLIYTHGTAAFLMFHIGEVPGYENGPETERTPGASDLGMTNRKMIQSNLYTLCLNALMAVEDEGADSA